MALHRRRVYEPTSHWWLGAVLPPLAGLVVGVVIAQVRGPIEGDFAGSQAIFPALVSTCVGGAIAGPCALLSYRRRERFRSLAAFAGVLSAGLVLLFGLSLLNYYIRRR